MSEDQQRKYAKAVMLGQRIYLNNQALLKSLSRTNAQNLMQNKALKNKIDDSLKDLCESLCDFEEITNIDLSEAKVSLEQSNIALNNHDTLQLYNNLQKLYRDDYLSKIISLLNE